MNQNTTNMEASIILIGNSKGLRLGAIKFVHLC